MTFRLDVAINYLVSDGLILPHGITPGSVVGGFNLITSEADWNSYTWNPPQEFSDLGVDASAGPKPTWAELQAAFTVASVGAFKRNTLNELRAFTSNLISVKAYGAKDSTHERQIKERLSSDTRLNRMNEYKEHYRNRYHEIKHWVNSLSEDAASVAKIDAWRANIDMSDVDGNAFALFSDATWTPPGEASAFVDHANVPTYEYIHHENPPPTITESSI